MLKPFSRTLLALALLSPLTAQAQQGDAARQKELEAARTDMETDIAAKDAKLQAEIAAL